MLKFSVNIDDTRLIYTTLGRANNYNRDIGDYGFMSNGHTTRFRLCDWGISIVTCHWYVNSKQMPHAYHRIAVELTVFRISIYSNRDMLQ